MTLFHALGPFAAQAGVVAAPGMVLLTPTSITHSGTSATLGANGQVTFSAVTSLSLNGVFSADFDNYVISIRNVASATAPSIGFRLRASGSDASGSNYTRQFIQANSTTVSAERLTENVTNIGLSDSAQRSGDSYFFYGPYLAQPTAMRSVNVSGYLGGAIKDQAATHSLSTSYDGFTVIPDSGNITGALQVYGVRS